MDSSDWLQLENEATRATTDSSSSPSPGPGDTLDCSQPRRLRPQDDQPVKCPRCDSNRTKFCYYNNYSLSQPRYFCKTCRRYWTKGGTLRNVPVGGGCRKVKKPTTPEIDKRDNINGIGIGIGNNNNINIEEPLIISMGKPTAGAADHLHNLPVTIFPDAAGVSGHGGLYGSHGDLANNLGSTYGCGPIDFAESKFEDGMGEPDGSHGFMMGGLMGSNYHMGYHYHQRQHEFLNGSSKFSHGLMGAAIGASLNDGNYNVLDTRQPLMLPHGEYDRHLQEHNNSSFISSTLIDVKPSNSRLVPLPYSTSGAGNECYGSGRPLDRSTPSRVVDW